MVKHLNRRRSRADHGPSPSHNSAQAAWASARRLGAPPPPSSVVAAVATALHRDNTSVPPSYDSPARLPVATAPRSWGSHRVAWSPQSRGSAFVGPHPPGVAGDTGACADRGSVSGTPVADSAQSARPSTAPLFASPWALPVVCSDSLQRLGKVN